jgi:adenosylcobinamide amidohydrolase
MVRKLPVLFTIILLLIIIDVNSIFADVEIEVVPLPAEVEAKAFVIKKDKDRLWEKTLILEFPKKRRVLSTIDGFMEVKAVANHSAHPEIWKKVCEEKKTKEEKGGKIYMREVKQKIAKHLGIAPEEIAMLATAADMDNRAVVVKEFKPFVVVALVTAGAKTNALRTGVDEGNYIEGMEPQGTVNIILLTNAQLTDGAMARAIITATEAKTAAFQDLNVPSSYTKGAQATGTGTDNIIVVTGTNGPRVSYTGGHSKIGELIGKAVYEAVVDALKRQDGSKILKQKNS